MREIYQYADIMTISAKKDGVVNMGGFVAMRSEELFTKAKSFCIMYEGYVTYGGMSGRDMDANTEFEQLDARIRQVKLLGDLLDEYGVPYQRPAGGHAIFIDAKRVLPNLPKEQFIAQTLAVELYLEAGIRGVEIGSILADRDPETHENRYPALELLRLAIPRRVLPQHLRTPCGDHDRLPHHLRGADPAPLHRRVGEDLTRRSMPIKRPTPGVPHGTPGVVSTKAAALPPAASSKAGRESEIRPIRAAFRGSARR